MYKQDPPSSAEPPRAPSRWLFSGGPVATLDPAADRPYGTIDDGAVLVENGVVSWVGSRAELESGAVAQLSGASTSELERVNLGGRWLTPGLVDCHTHLVYGGQRAREFEQRSRGASYEEIARAGGGILSTVRATRQASEEALFQAAVSRLDRLLAEGVTTVEVKSGYGLDTATELAMLRVARRMGSERPVDVRTTFLGAHALPAEYRDDRQAYLRLVIEEMLPAVAEAGLADAVDGFCEGIAFSVAEMEKVFDAAREHGLPIKLHAEQLSDSGGAAMAAGRGALSVDHLEYLGSDGVAALADSSTVAVLLPGAFYYLGETCRPPVDALADAGVPLAVATDHNPGSSPVLSLLAALNQACVLFGLHPEQALRGATVHAARALGLDDRGTIVAGQRADLALWAIEHPAELAYWLGANPCVGSWVAGRQVVGALEP